MMRCTCWGCCRAPGGRGRFEGLLPGQRWRGWSSAICRTLASNFSTSCPRSWPGLSNLTASTLPGLHACYPYLHLRSAPCQHEK